MRFCNYAPVFLALPIKPYQKETKITKKAKFSNVFQVADTQKKSQMAYKLVRLIRMPGIRRLFKSALMARSE